MSDSNHDWASRRIFDLEAEVERLRHKLNRTQAESADRFARLSAANALLERCYRELGKLSCPLDDLFEDISAHLAGQAAHQDGCRYEREHPALDTDDCPRCAEKP